MSTTKTNPNRGWITDTEGEPVPLVTTHIGGTKYDRVDNRRHRKYQGVLRFEFHINTYKSLGYNVIDEVVRDAMKLPESAAVDVHYGGCYGGNSRRDNPHMITVTYRVEVEKPSFIPSEATMKQTAPDYEKSLEEIKDKLIDSVQAVLDEELDEERDRRAKQYREHLASHFRGNAKEELDYEAREKALRDEVKQLEAQQVTEQADTIREWMTKQDEDSEVVERTVEMLTKDPHPHGGILGSF